MTRKLIIALYGDSEGKNQLNELVKVNGFWVWNGNSKNYLSFLTRQYLGWNGKRTTKFYEFIEDFKSLVDKYWDYELTYTQELIYKLMKDEKTNLLILHNLDVELTKRLSEEEAKNIIIIHLSKTEETGLKDNCMYFNVDTPDWKSEILKFIKNKAEEQE